MSDAAVAKQDAAPAPAPTPAAPAAAKPRKSSLLVILVGGLLIGIVGVGAFWLGTKKSAADTESEKAEAPAEHKEEPPAKPRGKVVKLKPIVVNLKQSKGTRYLKVSLGLEASSDAVAKELEQIDVQLLDLMVEKLSAVELSDVDNTAGHNKLKRDILIEVNELLEKGPVNKVYFSEFVIQ